MFSEARLRLQRAKDSYVHDLAQIDRMLRGAVALDPSVIEKARSVQKEYGATFGYVPCELKAAEQPKESPASKAAAKLADAKK